MTTFSVTEVQTPKVSLVAKFANRFGVDPGKLVNTLKATCFKGDKPISDEQMMALLIVADQYTLNPFTKEIFAFPDRNGIVPVVSVDGWSRIINEHPMLDGVEFEYHGDAVLPDSITCVIWRKDRKHPTRITEFMAECKRGTPSWNSHPRRMLRHKALIQCARIAFGFAGIYDEDEAQRIVTMGMADEVAPPAPPSSSAAKVATILRKPADVEDAQPAQPEARPDPAPTVWDLEKFTLDLLSCTDSEVAGLILDEARSELSEEDQLKLTAIYRDKFNTGA